MNKIDITFFGTDKFASVILQGLLNMPEIEINCVITQPDRVVGRKKQLQPSLVKTLALENNLEILQPASLDGFVIKENDLNVVVDYGLIIPQNIIDIPQFGSINIHPSILPKYRGPSPIQTTLLNGDTQTAVTIMKIDAKMDHGPIIAQNSFAIELDDTYTVLSNKLAEKGSEMLKTAIPDYINGKIKPVEQDHDQATFCKMLDRNSGLLDFGMSAEEIYNRYKAFTPWPGIWARLNSKRLKLLKIKPAVESVETGVISFVEGKIYIGCGQAGSIEVLELQIEGKKTMTAPAFINGYKNLNQNKLNA